MSDITLDSLIKQIRTSADTTVEAVEKLNNDVTSESFYKVSENCSSLNKLENKDSIRGVSLLGLKNHAMLSYLNSLILILLSKVEELKQEGVDDEIIEKVKNDSIKNTIVQRVVMERGVKGLEKKISYQLDKLIRNYRRAEEVKEKSVGNDVTNAAEDQKEEDEEEDEDSDLDFKPNTRALMASSKKSSKERANGSAASEDSKNEKYRPPKITAVAPPSSTVLEPGHQAGNQNRGANRRRKLQSMEEYLQEHGDAPSVGHSIGSTILNHGRDGIKTSKDLTKEQEIQRYEEENFTRLNLNVSKKDKKQKAKERKKQMENTFGGEDWGMFNNIGSGDSSNKRKRSSNAWERAKRKRQ